MSFDSEPWDATCEAEGTSTHDTCATEALILTLTLTLTLTLNPHPQPSPSPLPPVVRP